MRPFPLFIIRAQGRFTIVLAHSGSLRNSMAYLIVR